MNEQMKDGLVARRDMELALLTGAKDYLEEYGWCQGLFQNSEGRYCLVGAMDASRKQYNREHFGGRRRNSYVRRTAADGASNLLIEEMGTKGGGRGLVYWNDAHERTEDEVLKLLDDMIQERENDDEGS